MGKAGRPRIGTRCWYVLGGELRYEESHSLLAEKIDANPALLSEWFSRHPERWGTIGTILIGDADVKEAARVAIAYELERTSPNVQKTTKGGHLLSHHELYGTAMFRNVV
jgi:hypothetical protein